MNEKLTKKSIKILIEVLNSFAESIKNNLDQRDIDENLIEFLSLFLSNFNTSIIMTSSFGLTKQELKYEFLTDMIHGIYLKSKVNIELLTKEESH